VGVLKAVAAPERVAVPDPRIARALGEHAAAVATFRARANAIPADQWQAPRAAGKWSAAQEVEHISLSYETFLSQLEGGPGMRTMVSPLRALVLRWLVMPYLIRTGRFPRARAPRETRPVATAATKAELLSRIDRAADGLSVAAERESPGRRLSHPYFGRIPLMQALRMSAAHTRHHTHTIAQRDHVTSNVAQPR
jgi:DinB family protein